MTVVNSLLLEEVFVVKSIPLTEVLFQLVELISTNCIQVSSLQLLLHNSRVDERAHEHLSALEVISHKPGILCVLQVGLSDLLGDSFLLFIQRLHPHVVVRIDVLLRVSSGHFMI